MIRRPPVSTRSDPLFLFSSLFRAAHPGAVAAAFPLTPLMTAGFARLFLRQTLSPAVLLALVLAGVGALWVIFRADLGRLLALDLGTGEALFLLGCVCHAAYTIGRASWRESGCQYG